MKPSALVQQYLLAACQHPGQPLPTQQAIAEQLDVSVRTVARVIARFVADGAIQAVPGRGMCVASTAKPNPDSTIEAAGAIQRVRLWLQQHIERGTWPPGEPLPTQRAIKEHCGVGIRSVQHALHELVAAGLIHRHGRHWSVGPQLLYQEQTVASKVAWLLAPDVLAQDIPDMSGPFIADIGALESACQAFGLALQVHSWDRLDVERPPHALLALDLRTGDGERILDFWQRLRRQRHDLRLVRVYGKDQFSQRPRQYEHLKHGSIWTQVTRRVAEHVVSRQPDRVVCVIDLDGGGGFKENIRLLPELRYRLPHVPIDFQILTPERLDSLPAVCHWLEEKGHGTVAYFEGLLSNYQQTTLADWEESVTVRDSADWSLLSETSFTICNTVDTASRARQQQRQRQRGGWLLALRDAPLLFTTGVAVCVHDAYDTYRRLAMALHGGYPLERGRQGLMRPGVRLAKRETG